MDATDILIPAGTGAPTRTPPTALPAALLADHAVAALVDEAMLTPKPGLVDLRGRGAHRDMDWVLMCASARALHPTFAALAVAGADLPQLPDVPARPSTL